MISTDRMAHQDTRAFLSPQRMILSSEHALPWLLLPQNKVNPNPEHWRMRVLNDEGFKGKGTEDVTVSSLSEE